MPTLLPAPPAPTRNPTTPPPKSDLSDLARRIVHQQWPLRHHPDPVVRQRVLSLIQTHVEMLRRWR